MTCPKCRSIDAVSKADAWDALATIPPTVQGRLDKLEPIAEDARTVAMHCGEFAPKGAVCVGVAIEHLNALREHFGLDKLPTK
jgi:hypothetical protein